MSDPQSETWPALLADKRFVLDQLDTNYYANIANEHQFHQAWRELCDRYGERRGEKYLANLQDGHAHVAEFAETIETALALEDDTLTGVFWHAQLKVIQALSQRGVRFRSLCPILVFDIPDLGPKLSSFPYNQNVQAPLRSIFNHVIDLQLWILQYVYAQITCQFEEHLQAKKIEIEGMIEVHRNEWIEKVAIAEQEQEERRYRSISGSTISAPSGLNGESLFLLHPNDAFTHVKFLGYGSHGYVEAVQHRYSQELLARKVIKCDNQEEFEQRKPCVIREVEALKSLSHHHVITLRLFHCDPTNLTLSILLYPVAEGDLGQYLKDSSGHFKFNNHVDSWFGCLVSALHFAHAKKVVHQDIKPQNILIKDNQPMLTDFGTAKDFSAFDNSISQESVVHGTSTYLAPEDESGRERGRSTDIFSLGCVFAEMMTVRQGYTLEDFGCHRRLPHAITPESPFRANLPAVTNWVSRLEEDGRSRFVVGKILKMLTEDPADRPKIRHLKRDFRGADLLCDLCQ